MTDDQGRVAQVAKAGSMVWAPHVRRYRGRRDGQDLA